MKKTFTLIALFLAFAFANAQDTSAPEAPATPNTSKSSSSNTRKVQISVNKNLKLNLKIDDEQYDLKLKFPKKYVKVFRKEFLTNFRNSGDNYIWNGEAASTKVKIRGNKINIHFLKGEISSIEMDKIKSFAEGVFIQLDWDIETLGL